MATSRNFFSRIKYPLILVVFVCLTTGFILIGAHLQMLEGIMPISNYNGLYINMNVIPVSMIAIPNTGGDYKSESAVAIICDDFSTNAVDWSSKGTSMKIQNGALHIVTGLFPKARMILWNESSNILPEEYEYSADLKTSSENDTAGLAINLQSNGEGTVFLIRPVDQSFFIGQWSNQKLIPIADWKRADLKIASDNVYHLDVNCTSNQANFLINGTSSATVLLAEPCNNGAVGIFLDKASWQLWADNVALIPIK